MDVLDQFELGLAGADNQDFLGAGEGFHDLMVVLLVFGLAAAADGAALAVQVALPAWPGHHRFFNVVRADVHDVGFVVVEPDDCMVVRHDFLSWKDK